MLNTNASGITGPKFATKWVTPLCAHAASSDPLLRAEQMSTHRPVSSLLYTRTCQQFPGGLRLRSKEHDAWMARAERAKRLAIQGDESEFRAMFEDRFIVECLETRINSKTGAVSKRRRPKSNAMFITPSGVLEGRLRGDLDLFIDRTRANLFAAQLTAEEALRGKRFTHWTVRGTTARAELLTTNNQ